MSETYVPNGSNPAPTVGAGTRFTILSSSNTTPIAVTFVAPTTINDQDTIEIEGHLVNTAANGVWQATKTTASVYTLNGSTGNGVGGQSGYAIDYQVTPAATLPTDGDKITASSVNPALEGNADLGPFLYRRSGAARLVAEYDHDMGTGTTTAWSSTTTTTTSFVTATSGSGLFGNTGGSNPAPPAIQAGDYFEIFCTLQIISASGGTGHGISVGLSVEGGSYTDIAPSELAMFANANGFPASLAFKTAPFGSAKSYFDFAIMVRGLTAGSAAISLYGAGHLLVRHMRPN